MSMLGALLGYCQSLVDPRPAVTGPHLHWDGERYVLCPMDDWCPWPSCHPADEDDRPGVAL
jgi:hypothetical protein